MNINKIEDLVLMTYLLYFVDLIIEIYACFLNGIANVMFSLIIINCLFKPGSIKRT